MYGYRVYRMCVWSTKRKWQHREIMINMEQGENCNNNRWETNMRKVPRTPTLSIAATFVRSYRSSQYDGNMAPTLCAHCSEAFEDNWIGRTMPCACLVRATATGCAVICFCLMHFPIYIDILGRRVHRIHNLFMFASNGEYSTRNERSTFNAKQFTRNDIWHRD